jgi:N-acetylmuramoyl-L-alanine amidase
VRLRKILFLVLAVFVLTGAGWLSLRLAARRGQKLEKEIVVLDPGHGGFDPGAIGVAGTEEKEVNLDVALRLEGLLKQEKVKVVLTRSGDKFVSLRKRWKLANKRRAALFVSLHCNAHTGRNRPEGLETYYWHSQSEELARMVHSKVLLLLKIKDNDVRVSNFVVVRNTSMPAILVEMGYIDHREEETLLRNSDFRQRMAEALKEGILEYMKAYNLGPWSTMNRG